MFNSRFALFAYGEDGHPTVLAISRRDLHRLDASRINVDGTVEANYAAEQKEVDKEGGKVDGDAWEWDVRSPVFMEDTRRSYFEPPESSNTESMGFALFRYSDDGCLTALAISRKDLHRLDCSHINIDETLRTKHATEDKEEVPEDKNGHDDVWEWNSRSPAFMEDMRRPDFGNLKSSDTESSASTESDRVKEEDNEESKYKYLLKEEVIHNLKTSGKSRKAKLGKVVEDEKLQSLPWNSILFNKPRVSSFRRLGLHYQMPWNQPLQRTAIPQREDGRSERRDGASFPTSSSRTDPPRLRRCKTSWYGDTMFNHTKSGRQQHTWSSKNLDLDNAVDGQPPPKPHVQTARTPQQNMPDVPDLISGDSASDTSSLQCNPSDPMPPHTQVGTSQGGAASMDGQTLGTHPAPQQQTICAMAQPGMTRLEFLRLCAGNRVELRETVGMLREGERRAGKRTKKVKQKEKCDRRKFRMQHPFWKLEDMLRRFCGKRRREIICEETESEGEDEKETRCEILSSPRDSATLLSCDVRRSSSAVPGLPDSEPCKSGSESAEECIHS